MRVIANTRFHILLAYIDPIETSGHEIDIPTGTDDACVTHQGLDTSCE